MNNIKDPQYRKLFYVMIVLILLTPLGLLTSYSTWGEWSRKELKKIIGYVPQGLDKFADIWKGFLPDYQHASAHTSFIQSLFYIFSAALGALIIYAILAILLNHFKNKGSSL
jgi:ABC-type spermidine/putrescine transport system permease subunit II